MDCKRRSTIQLIGESKDLIRKNSDSTETELKNLLVLIPSNDVLSMTEFEVKQNELKNLFINLDSKISFTTDCWTSSNYIAFMGITGHWIDEDWKLHVTTLDFLELGKSHTGIHLYEALMKVIDTYEIHHKMLGITLNNASNNNI